MFSRHASFLGHPSREISLRSRIIWKTPTGVTWVWLESLSNHHSLWKKCQISALQGSPFFFANLLGFDLSWCFCLMASIPWDEIFTTFHHQFGEAFASGDALWPQGSSTWISWEGSAGIKGYDHWDITYNPNILLFLVGYDPYTNHLLISWHIQVSVCPAPPWNDALNKV